MWNIMCFVITSKEKMGDCSFFANIYINAFSSSFFSFCATHKASIYRLLSEYCYCIEDHLNNEAEHNTLNVCYKISSFFLSLVLYDGDDDCCDVDDDLIDLFSFLFYFLRLLESWKMKIKNSYISLGYVIFCYNGNCKKS